MPEPLTLASSYFTNGIGRYNQRERSGITDELWVLKPVCGSSIVSCCPGAYAALDSVHGDAHKLAPKPLGRWGDLFKRKRRQSIGFSLLRFHTSQEVRVKLVMNTAMPFLSLNLSLIQPVSRLLSLAAFSGLALHLINETRGFSRRK